MQRSPLKLPLSGIGRPRWPEREEVMADIVLSSAFDTDNFWAARSGAALLTDKGEYRFENTAGFFVKVTDLAGTFLYSGDDPASGTYTAITVYSDAGFTTQLASYSSTTDIA